MTSPELDNLVRIGKLKLEPPTDDEIAGLLRSGVERLSDAVRAERTAQCVVVNTA